MRTKVDKDFKRREVVHEDIKELEGPEPPSKPEKAKRPKKQDIAESGLNSKDVPALEVSPLGPEAVVEMEATGNEEIEAAVNSISEPVVGTANNVEELEERVPIENHLSEDHVPVPVPPPPADSVPDSASLQNQCTSSAELEVPVQKEVEAIVAKVCTYDSVIDEVARGDIIVKTPPRKPPKKRRNDECKSKEKLNFDNNKGKKKGNVGGAGNDGAVVVETVLDSTANPGEVTATSETAAGEKSRTKRTPKKRKFHDEQEDDNKVAPASKPKVKKKSPKSKSEDVPSGESSPSKKVSPNAKKAKGKAQNGKNEISISGEGDKQSAMSVEGATAGVTKVKKEKVTKKSKKAAVSELKEEPSVNSTSVASAETPENAHCSSDSGIGGTDSEMKPDSGAGSAVSNGQTMLCVGAVHVKLEVSDPGNSAQKPAEPKKKSKSKPKKLKDVTKEQSDAKSGCVDGESKEVVDKMKTPKKPKVKKRKSEESKEKTEKSETSDQVVKQEELSPPDGADKADKPPKKKKKIVKIGEGEVKKVVKKKKKVVKKSLDEQKGENEGEEKENVENKASDSTNAGQSASVNGQTEGADICDSPKDDDDDDDDDSQGDSKDEGTEISERTSSTKLGKFNREKKILETRECSICGHKTRGLAALTRHKKRAHQIISKPPKFKCDRCDFDAAKRVVFAKHMAVHDVTMCHKCPFVCSSADDLEEHIIEEHKNKGDLKLCRLCTRYVRCAEGDITLEKHMEECKGKVPLVCKECNKEFKYESGLKVHISTHFPDQPKLYTCELCSYQSNYKANLHKHIQNIHQEREKTIKCGSCDKMFYKEEHMRRHLRLHTESRPFECDKCDKTFKTPGALRCHAESHSPSRPFKCDIDGCTKAFRTQKFLRNHMEELHQLGEKKYQCPVDGCKFAFFKKSHLKRHEITHTGERNYHCMWPDCGKSFRHSDNLKVHQRQHTNEKPIKCSLCNFSCRQRNSLQYHIKRHHPPKVEISEVTADGSQNETVVNDVEPEPKPSEEVSIDSQTPASNEIDTSVKSENKGFDLYEFNDDDSCADLPVVFRRDKPRSHTLSRRDLDQLHDQASKVEPKFNSLPEGEKSELEEQVEDVKENGIKEETPEEKPLTEVVKTAPKKKKKKVVATKKTSPKSVKKTKSPKSPKSPKTASSPRAPKSPRSPKVQKPQVIKKKGSPETSKKKTALKKKVSPQNKKVVASKKKAPVKKKDTKTKAKAAAAKKGKAKKAAKGKAKEEKPKEEKIEEEEPTIINEKEIVSEPSTGVEDANPQCQSPKKIHKPQSPQSDGSSPSPQSPHSDRSDSPLLSDTEVEVPPQLAVLDKAEAEHQNPENNEEVFQEPEPVAPKEEAMSPGQAQQEAIDRSLEDPVIDEIRECQSQQEVHSYSPSMQNEDELKTEEQQVDDEEQRVSSDDEVPSDILLTPPRAPAPPPPQSPSEEDEEEVMQPVQSPVPDPVPVPVPVQEPLSHPEPMSNQPLSQDQQADGSEKDVQSSQPPSAQFPQNTTPECDLGQYLQDLSVPAASGRDSVPEEPNRLQRLEELAEKPHEDSRDIPRSASVTSNVITHTSIPFQDMSHKRMEILACDRSQEQHYQRDTASALPRIPDPPTFDTFNPLNSIHSASRDNNFLRQNENIFSSQTTPSSFMRLGETEAMRQRMATPFLPQNDRTAIPRLPDASLRPTNPTLLRRPTTMPSTDMFPPPAMSQTMPRNPFTNTWSGQEVRPPPWPQAPYLQRTIDRQPNATPATLFAKENYLAASREFMFDPSRTMTERNMFASLSSPQPQRDLAPDTFPLELSYFGGHAYSGTATLDYSRPPCGTAQKSFDERYRQTASTAMGEFRGLPQTSTSEMFSGIGVNSSFNLDKYMYPRDPVYHPQHVGENANSAFLTHSAPTQHSVFDREYPHRSLYPQNTPYQFLEDRQYSTAAKLTHSTNAAVNQDREFMARTATTENQIPPDPYRCGMLYNVMNRYPFE